MAQISASNSIENGEELDVLEHERKRLQEEILKE
jgi:hypothetical protein